MAKYLVWFDNCVTDDPLIEFIEAENPDECWEKAYPLSCRTGYSQGNFEIYENVFDKIAEQEMKEMEAENNGKKM